MPGRVALLLNFVAFEFRVLREDMGRSHKLSVGFSPDLGKEQSAEKAGVKIGAETVAPETENHIYKSERNKREDMLESAINERKNDGRRIDEYGRRQHTVQVTNRLQTSCTRLLILNCGYGAAHFAI